MAFEKQIKRFPLDFSKPTLYIDNKVIRFGKKEIRCDDIVRLKRGIFVNYVNLIKTSTTFMFTIEDSSKKRIFLSFVAMFYWGIKPKQALFEEIDEAIWQHATKHLCLKIHKTITTDGQNFDINKDVQLQPAGIKIHYYKMLAKKEAFIPWKMLEYDIQEGKLGLHHKEDKNIKTSLDLYSDWNASLLWDYLSRILVPSMQGIPIA